ncbi:MAG: zf-TFIIB domain-containing protein [Planctomycetes bacterium]|nr:zf-TFIIB domain-containing protein [Planctomycetota bacterium]
MRCPRCEAVVLEERDRDGIQVDICPKCRGVWLDRGELERLVAKATQEIDQEIADRTRRQLARQSAPVHDDERRAPSPLPYDEPRRREYDDDDDDRRRYAPDDRYPPRKRRWFEMFDIFD